MDNQQLYILNNNQEQVLLTGMLGDGHLTKPKNENSNSLYTTNCIHKEYVEYKKELLGDLSFNISSRTNNGYKKGIIYTVTTKRSKVITDIKNKSLVEILEKLNELGIALWFYDDGSLHKRALFYNLNTQKFSKEENITVLEYLKKYNIYAKVTPERKKDGRIFYYLRISKYEGAYEISKILNKYYIDCYKYKIWSSETIQKWSKLQEQLKSTDKILSKKAKGLLLNNMIL
jgi:hypothetical protein